MNNLNKLKIITKIIGKFSTNLIFPHHCPTCQKINLEKNGLCQECWNKVLILKKPACDICFYPFNDDEFDGTICPNCIKERPVFTKARSVFGYDDLIKTVIFNFKYNDKTSNANFFSDLMVNACKDIIDYVDIIIPVPLHPKRLRKRKYNQASLLANGLGKRTNKIVMHEILQRKINTRPQVGLLGKERLKNVKDAFCVNEKFQNEIRGKNILLIDDVMTTGATLNNCAKILLKHSAKDVYVATVARTVQGIG
jgi:ComF family protein